MSQYAVLGSPIQHSLSPHLFQLFAEQTGQTLTYDAIEVRPEDLEAVLRHLRQQGYQGLNLTAPLKEKAFLWADEVSAAAQTAKAINMLSFREDDSSYGDNSDGLGFIRDLTQAKGYSLANKSILILGAGGAVRGLLPALLEQKPRQLIVANRSEEKARLLVDDFQNQKIPIFSSPWDEMAAASYDLVIQGTAAAMKGGKLVLPLGILNRGACCYDLGYGQNAVPFLTWAKEQGAAFSYDGLGMLIEQAAQAFYVWRHQKVDTAAITRLLLSAPSQWGKVAQSAGRGSKNIIDKREGA